MVDTKHECITDESALPKQPNKVEEKKDLSRLEKQFAEYVELVHRQLEETKEILKSDRSMFEKLTTVAYWKDATDAIVDAARQAALNRLKTQALGLGVLGIAVGEDKEKMHTYYAPKDWLIPLYEEQDKEFKDADQFATMLKDMIDSIPLETPEGEA
jgi:2-hydroxy-3-keto-5-methylthiopentenyl-1-phosphate phosphatase